MKRGKMAFLPVGLMLIMSAQVFSQHCAQCNIRPVVAFLSGEMKEMVPPTDEAAKKKWVNLYGLQKWIGQYIQGNDVCIQLQPVADVGVKLQGRQTELNSQWNYLLLLKIQPDNDKYAVTLLFKPSCSGEILLQKTTNIQLTADWDL